MACSSGDDRILEVQPDGAGRVYSESREHDPLGIDCRSDGKTRRGACVKELTLVETVTLVAEPAPGATFDHWEVEPTGTTAFEATDARLTLNVGRGDLTTRHVRAIFVSR